MNILLSNDDGVRATGISVLERVLKELGTVWVVAPELEQSAKSHAITMHEFLRIRQYRDNCWSVSGTPADCVYVALNHLLKDNPPDLVISGVNHGPNVGSDVHYSGTVAAAREGCLNGIPSLAVSLFTHNGSPQDFERAALVTKRVVQSMMKSPLQPGVYLNLNVPDGGELKGLRATQMGPRNYQPLVELRKDPRGKSYAWIGGPPMPLGDELHHDGDAVMAGWATLTPLQIDVTSYKNMEDARGRCDA